MGILKPHGFYQQTGNELTFFSHPTKQNRMGSATDFWTAKL
jgi:hypothetical protein